jgi:hypothetical protein
MTVSVNKHMAMLVKLTTVLFLLILTGTPCPGQMIKVVQVGTGDDLPQPYVYSLNFSGSGQEPAWSGTTGWILNFIPLQIHFVTISSPVHVRNQAVCGSGI